MAGESILVIGNCQADLLAECLQMMLGDANIVAANRRQIKRGEIDIAALLAETDRVFLQVPGYPLKAVMKANPRVRVTPFPAINFTGFHPDNIYAQHGEESIQSPLGGNNSAIALFAWMHGVSLEKTVSLFRGEVFDAIGYHDHMQASVDALIASGDASGLDLRGAVARLSRSGCFMHCTIHPRLPMIAELARAILDKLGIVPDIRNPEHYLPDPMFRNIVWPIYPEIGARLGIPGEYAFKSPKLAREGAGGTRFGTLSLRQFVEKSFEAYAGLSPDRIDAVRFRSETFLRLKRFLGDEPGAEAPGAEAPAADRPAADVAANPYRALPASSFWRRSVVAPPLGEIDPVTAPRFTVSPADRIATAGSCFAQHIARRLAAGGHHYLVTEAGEHLDTDRRADANYGVYSARYGNVYTARQLVQLFHRAYGDFVPADTAWPKGDRFVDPFRPEIEPGGFADVASLLADRDAHFAAVRQLFETLDIFVFTLGLTETWRARADGATFPVAPGVTGATIDPRAYEFVNFSASEVLADLDTFVQLLRGVNPRARILLTVSPVPLIATYEPRHVLVSTIASKAALRTAADDLVRRHGHVDYFPSYEIITATHNRYFEVDLRTVSASGVDHVMRVFGRHYAPQTAQQPSPGLADELAAGRDIVCEEELLDR